MVQAVCMLSEFIRPQYFIVSILMKQIFRKHLLNNYYHSPVSEKKNVTLVEEKHSACAHVTKLLYFISGFLDIQYCDCGLSPEMGMPKPCSQGFYLRSPVVELQHCRF